MTRIDRTQYWLFGLAYLALVAALAFYTPVRGSWVVVPGMLLLVVPRLNDIGRSGWWAAAPAFAIILLLIPAATFIIPRPVAVAGFNMIFALSGIALIVLGLIPGRSSGKVIGGRL